MPVENAHVLEPLIRKLGRRSELASAEVRALEGLPVSVTNAPRGKYIVREGEKPGDCFVILDGFVYRSKITKDGARQILALHLTGDLVCAHDRLLGEADHNIQSLTDVRIGCIPQEAVLAITEAFPAISRAILRDNLVDASIYREWLLNNSRRNARARVAHLICEMAKRQEMAGVGAAPTYVWPMTQEEIGDAVGLTAVHVNRTVQDFRRGGIVEVRNHRLTIQDWDSLRAEADFRSNYLH